MATKNSINATPLTNAVLFSDSNSSYNTDDKNLAWDNSISRMRLANGTTDTFATPQVGTLLHVVSSNGTINGRISVDTYNGAGTTGSIIQGRKARGTSTSPTAAQANDSLALLGGDGYGDTGFHSISTGAFIVRAEAAHTDSSAPTYLVAMTTPTGSTTVQERLRVTSDGIVTFGGVTSSQPAIKPNGTALDFRLADDSGYAPINASSLNSVVVSGSATPTLAVTGTTSVSGTNTGDNVVGTPTGTVDGVNQTFTVTAVPKWIVIDGLTYFDGQGYSIAGLTLTTDIPPTGFIRAII